MEEGGESPGLRGFGFVVVGHRVLGEEHAHQGACVLHSVFDAFGGECLGHEVAEGGRVPAELGVHLGVGGAQARESGGDGYGVTREGACLVDGTVRCEVGP